jgi:hypothetical protein
VYCTGPQPLGTKAIVNAMVSKIVFTLQLHPDPDPDSLTGFYPDRNTEQPNGMLQKSPRCACEQAQISVRFQTLQTPRRVNLAFVTWKRL